MVSCKPLVRIVCICLAVVLSQPVTVCTAQESGSQTESRLRAQENILFGAPQSGSSLEKRLQQVEKTLLGKTGQGSFSERLKATEALLQGKDSSDYLPPLPPMLDRSEVQKQPVEPPKGNLNTDRPEYVEAAGSGEKTRGMLREAMSLYSRGKVAQAEKIYQNVLASDFRNVDANFNLGAIAEEKGNLKEAARFYRAAAQANPRDPELKDALDGVERALAAQAQSPAPRIAEATPDEAMRKIAEDAAVAYRQKNYTEAINKLNFLVRQTPMDASVHFALGQALRGSGDNYQALKHLRTAASLDRKNDLYLKTLQQAEGEGQPQMQDQIARASDSRPEGSLTPFDLPNSGQDSGSSRGGDLEGFLARLSNTSGRRYYYGAQAPSGRPYEATWGTGSGGLRLSRVVGSSLSGAAVGAMTNRGRPGGMRRGAMRGALYGGLYGLMFGGF